jgi:predicted nucleotidyltransferase
MSIGDLVGIPTDVQRDVELGIKILKDGGCTDVYVLGSVAEGRTHPESDIDFAVRGCPPEQFFMLQGQLLMELARSSDLIDLDVDPDLSKFLEHEATLVHVG